jgi:hypothetical protein
MPSLSRAESPDCLGPFASLQSAHDHIWSLLEAATRDRAASWRLPVLATIGPDGAPRARTVVLRGVERAAAGLVLHSDRRAGKIVDIERDGRVALTFHDPVSALQLRAEGAAALVVDGDVLDRAWARVPEGSRPNYASVDPPGAPLGGAGAIADGRPNFAIIRVELRRLEWLWLAPGGHVRGESRREADDWVQQALTP